MKGAVIETRPATLTILMDGRWDIEDLSKFADGLEEIYGYFCSVMIEDQDLRRRLNDIVQREFWNGNFERSRLGERVYRMLPDAAGLKVKSIRYASPGAVELLGLLGVLLLMAKVVKAWTDAGSGLFDLYEKAEKFFVDRPMFRKPGRVFNLSAVAPGDVDDARQLMFELGETIGLDRKMCERVLDMSGNPVSGLRFTVALALQARKISDLESRGLLNLPRQAVRAEEPESSDESEISPPKI